MMLNAHGSLLLLILICNKKYFVPPSPTWNRTFDHYGNYSSNNRFNSCPMKNKGDQLEVKPWKSDLLTCSHNFFHNLRPALQFIPWRLYPHLVDGMAKVLLSKGILQLKEFIKRGSKHQNQGLILIHYHPQGCSIQLKQSMVINLCVVLFKLNDIQIWYHSKRLHG